MTSTLSKTQLLPDARDIAFADPIPVRLQSPRTFTIGLIGFGRIGSGFAERLRDRGGEIAARHACALVITDVLVRDASRVHGGAYGSARIANDAVEFMRHSFDVVVEATGVVEPIVPLLSALLERGTPVVTANKELLARAGGGLRAIAARTGTRIGCEASVAAGIPLFHVLDGALQTDEIRAFEAILNGTSNFVLDEMGRTGAPLTAALERARRLGLAEPDASADVDGRDAARKLAVLCERLFGIALDPERIAVEGIGDVERVDILRAADFGYALKPLASARTGANLDAWIAPACVPSRGPLASVSGAENGIVLSCDRAGPIFLSGPGAGPEPTAAALLDDVLRVTQGSPAGPPRRTATRMPDTRAVPDPRWLVTVTADGDRVLASDLLDYLAAAGLRFDELRRSADDGATTIAGVTRAVAPRRVAAVRDALAAVEGILRSRFFRIGASGGDS